MSSAGARLDTPHPARWAAQQICAENSWSQLSVPGAITQAVERMNLVPYFPPPGQVSLLLCGLEDPPGGGGLTWQVTLLVLSTSTSCADAHHSSQMGSWATAMLGLSTALTLFFRLERKVWLRKVWPLLTPCSHPGAQETPGSLLLPQGPGGAASRELWHACPSSSGEGPKPAPASLSTHSKPGCPTCAPPHGSRTLFSVP